MADLGRGHTSEDSDELGGSCLCTLYFEEGRVTVMQANIFKANQLGAALLIPSRDTWAMRPKSTSRGLTATEQMTSDTYSELLCHKYIHANTIDDTLLERH